MKELQFNVQNIWQDDFFGVGQHFDGLGLCFAGIVIVFSALVLICLFITVLPKALEKLDEIFPPALDPHAASPAAAAPAPAAGDEAEKVAAIAYALRQQRGG